MASGRDISRKNSAGPPMPNDVRDASGSSSRTPGRARSQARLDLVRQVIAQLLYIAGAHQQHEVVRSDDLLECFLRLREIADIEAVRELLRPVRRGSARDVVVAGAVHVRSAESRG